MHSNTGVAERYKNFIIFVQHNVIKTGYREQDSNSIDIESAPLEFFGILLFEGGVAGLYVIGGNVGVEVVDVVVFNAVSEGAEDMWDIEEGAPLEGRFLEVPGVSALAVGQVHGMLEVEEDGPDCLGKVYAEIHLQWGEAEQFDDPERNDEAEYSFEGGPAKQAKSFNAVVANSQDPDYLD